MKKMMEAGNSYTRIGKAFGVSRQRVHQILTGYKSPSQEPKKTHIPWGWSAKDGYTKEGIWKKGMGGRDFLAEIVRNRDNYTCQICGKIWHEGERRLDTHHLDRNKENDHSCENYKNFDEMITLCHRCHLNLDQVRSSMTRGHKKLTEAKVLSVRVNNLLKKAK